MNILIFISGLLSLPTILAYGSSLAMTSAAASITNFYQDLAFCACDLTPSICDPYCCCDSVCSTTSTAQWTTAYTCLSTSTTVERFCNQSGVSGFGSFDDLSCVYYSRRGSIGKFYDHPALTSLTTPVNSLFSSLSNTATTNTLFAGATGTSNLGTDYSSTNPYLQSSSTAYLFVPKAGPGGNCISGVLNATGPSNSYACSITPTTQNCATLNANYQGIICTTGPCAAAAGGAITASSISTTNCINVLTSLTISYTLTSTQSAYSLTSSTVTPIYSIVPLGTNTFVTVTHTVTITPSNSGNPGYQLGQPITINLSPISDAAGACVTTATATGTLSILFGQAIAYRCESPTACVSTLYIDSLPTTAPIINQYASQSATTATISGTYTPANCSYQNYELQIIYSYGGWQLDPQFYILGAQWSPNLSPDTTTPTTKYLGIKWVYVDPVTVSTPPTNLFYTYFSYLWTPLKQQFGIK